MLRTVTAGFLLLSAGAAGALFPAARAQESAPQAVRLDGGSATLDGPWQFHPGDNAAWSAPAVDDATGHDGWESIDANRTLGAEAIPHYTGYVWYRRTIEIAPASDSHTDLALLLGHVNGAYQLYWNGALIGSSGNLPPHPRWYAGALPAIYSLGPARQGVLALRVWTTSDLFYAFHRAAPLTMAPVAGSPATIAALKAAADYQWFLSQQYSFTLSLLYALVLVISLIGWLWNRGQHVLLWMAAFCFCSLLVQVVSEVWVPWPAYCAVSSWVLPTNDVVLWYLLYHLLGLQGHRRLGKVTFVLAAYFIATAVIQPVLGVLDWTGPAFHFWYGPRMASKHVSVAVAALYPFVLVGFGLTRRLDWARLVLAITAVLAKLMSILSSGFAVRWPDTPLFSIHGNPFAPVTLANTALLLSVVYAVYRQQWESNRRQTVLEREFQNARAVQQVLIPEETPTVPGFRVESVYKPAGEVGGDFFQIVALPGGALLAVIGDVSGKGMPAAMTVSLLVGTLRTLAHFTQSPGEMLAAMNQRMLRRSQGGFTTCLALRADADGTLTIANAGHIAPYLEGAELAVESGLPLGLDAGTTYAESTCTMGANQQLTLVTDGVVEARNATGRLFGFERTAAMAGQSAESIAEAAEEFGQQDDITVLTLTRVAVAAAQGTAFAIAAEAGA